MDPPSIRAGIWQAVPTVPNYRAYVLGKITGIAPVKKDVVAWVRGMSRNDATGNYFAVVLTRMLDSTNNEIPGASTRGVKKWYSVNRTIAIAKKHGANDAASETFLPAFLLSMALIPTMARTIEMKTVAKRTSVALNMSWTMLYRNGRCS